jgi:hypothetical protein
MEWKHPEAVMRLRIQNKPVICWNCGEFIPSEIAERSWCKKRNSCPATDKEKSWQYICEEFNDRLEAP